MKAGDTLFAIANAHNTTVDNILMFNPRKNPNAIFPGEVFYIPVNSCTPTPA